MNLQKMSNHASVDDKKGFIEKSPTDSIPDTSHHPLPSSSETPVLFARRILVLDDDPSFSLYLKELLEGCYAHPTVEMVNDGLEGLNRIKSFAPDILLLDLMVPGIDGFELCRQLMLDPLTRQIRVIVISGYLNRLNIQLALEAGVERCMDKPLNVDQLIAALWPN